MPEFFLELFSEEIPAGAQSSGALLLSIAIHKSIPELVPVNQHLKTYFSPRRIAVMAQAARTTKSVSRRERGPRVGAPESAVSGFLRKFGAHRGQLIEENNFYVLSVDEPERSALDVIMEKLPPELARMTWPKSMRWGQSGDFTWVRPLRRIVCLLDGEVVPITLGPLKANDETEGHRVLGPGSFTVSSAVDWEDKLRMHRVVADQVKRRKIIAESITDKAGELGLSVAEDAALLNEVTGLVEWPRVLIGRIDDKFMDLPWEVRELSMKVNQKYFALRDAEGKPAPYFAIVANLAAPDDGAAIVAGNERVLRARLSDARHFWDLDLKTSLDALLPKLEKITFHAKIGTQLQRAERISDLAEKIALNIAHGGSDASLAKSAGLYCKADLVTGMVGEFPELQGTMGGYYGERMYPGPQNIILGHAIKTHYQPKGPNDTVPYGIVAESVALADKLDMLTQFFRIGAAPTGSSDPYALRRAALGVIRIILENDRNLSLGDFIENRKDVLDFILDRLRVKLRNEGERFDVLDAVLAAGSSDNLTTIMKRVTAVSDFLKTSEGANLMAVYARAANILRIEDAKDGPHRLNIFDESFATEPDKQFRKTLRLAYDEAVDDFYNRNYTRAMEGLAQLRDAVDVFFDKVIINDPVPSVRRNRLKLLAQLCDTMHQIADFSKLEG